MSGNLSEWVPQYLQMQQPMPPIGNMPVIPQAPSGQPQISPSQGQLWTGTGGPVRAGQSYAGMPSTQQQPQQMPAWNQPMQFPPITMPNYGSLGITQSVNQIQAERAAQDAATAAQLSSMMIPSGNASFPYDGV